MGRDNSERPGQAQNNANGQDRPSEKAMVNWTRIVGFFTGLLFVATGISDYIIWRELRSDERAERFSEEQQRAFFGLPTVGQFQGTVDKDTKEPTLGIVAQWRNLGSTRATWATGWASIEYFPNGAPYNFDVTRPMEAITEPLHTAVGPNAPFDIGPIGLNHNESVQADTGKGEVLAWGLLQYADIYDPENTHSSRFCVKLVPSGQAANNITKQTVVIYKTHPYRNDCNKSE
jgi:hypothetical protein